MSTPPRPGGVDAALAEMQRKLAELQSQLTGADAPRDTGARVPGAAPPPVDAVTTPPPTILPPATAPAPPVSVPLPPAAPPVVAHAVPAPHAAPMVAIDPDDQARAMVAEAQLTANRMVEDAQARVNGMRAQIDHLLEIRSNLLQSARGLLTEYDSALRHLEAAETLAATHDPGGPPLHTAPPVPEPSRPVPAASAVPPRSTAGAASGTAAPAALATPAGDGRSYEGRVVVEAGPFADIATLSSFEQTLGRLPGAEDVYVRGFADDRAIIDLTLAGPLDLATALHDALPFRFDVAAADADRITLRVHPGS